jgi:tRNA nucleotidyltransferase (CCA-adding enzyme)
MDAASRLADEKGYTGEDKAILVASAMCHDLGKATTTDTSGEKITSYGHHEVGAKLTNQFLQNIGMKKNIVQTVVPLVSEHMSHIFFDSSSKKSTIMHLAEKLNDATIEQLEIIIRSDMEGRPPKPIELPEAAQTMIDLAKEKGVYQGKAESLISGKDLLSISPTITGGKDLGDILKEVRNKQLRGEISTKEEALVYADKLLQKYFGLIKGNDIIKALDGESGPIVGEILQEAWIAQKDGAITNENDALYWLYNYVDGLKIEEEPEVFTEE